MKIVTLFRHAKSGEKDNPRIDDFDRPLSERGIKAAPKMGAAIRDLNLRPDLVICSPSVRTRQTLTLACVEAWDSPPKTTFDKRIYEASVETLTQIIKDLPDDVNHVMLVGHNPGLQDFAVTLAVSGRERSQIKDKLPTAALVSLEFDEELWKDVQPATGHVALFLTPNTLPPHGHKHDYPHR